jgi:hypothetical protein
MIDRERPALRGRFRQLHLLAVLVLGGHRGQRGPDFDRRGGGNGDPERGGDGGKGLERIHRATGCHGTGKAQAGDFSVDSPPRQS